ncbi:hypothetical protein [Chelativorans alearense]|uniref:hypothetical protein n=1 Tax=Chelativorans alearense TaxID=2681495 RepID=UPI0013D1905F|nr:hypothetical protein [Chelativorans alearense]
MYRLDPAPEFWTPVNVRSPGEGGETETFRAKFRALTVDAFNAHDLSTPEGTKVLLDEVLKDIDEVEAKDGSPLRYTKAVHDHLCNVPHVRTALIAAYHRAFSEALAGN